MIYGMYLSTMGAMCQSARHATTANNLANANTNGFKPDWTQIRAVPTESIMQGSTRRGIDDLMEKIGGGSWLDRTVTNFTPGPKLKTDNPLDLALEDTTTTSRFFMVKPDPQSDKVMLTRDGSFQTNNEGVLVNSTGALVVDSTGQPITLPAGGDYRIISDGTIMDESANPAQAVGQVGILATAEPEKMKKIGANLFSPEDAEVAVDQNGVVSGVLEQSSSNSIREMVNMIDGHRMYETNMKFLTMQDESLGSIVQRLGAIA